MVSGIYLIINKINGHMYVGGSVDIEKRLDEHKRGKDADNQAIDRAILKYGKENFSYQVITELPTDWNIIGEHEKYWIKLYNTFKDSNHYNLTEGGEGISGWKHTDETKFKISEANKGKTGYWKDKNFSDKHKQKLSASHKGQESWNKGKTDCYSDESIQKMSKAKKGEKCYNWKNYARIHKNGFNNQGKRIYCIKYNGKIIKTSFHIHKLYKWWGTNYPNELLYLEI